MPIEIRELVIKAIVDESEDVQKTNVPEGVLPEDQVEEIVSLCIEKVFEILKEKNER